MSERWDKISPCGLYRYELGIPVNGEGGCGLFILHNPSTAHREKDDPTSTRVIGFGESLGLSAVVIANPMAYRATDKRELLGVTDPVGPDNRDIVRGLAEHADIVIVGWGNVHKRLRHHVSRMQRVLEGIHLCALQTNGDGSPQHPLFMRADRKPRRWTP